MTYVTLVEVKAHANVEGDVTDAMLQLYIDSAEAHVSNYLNRSLDSLLDEVVEPAEPDPATFPKPVKHAILLLVADAIEQRSTQIVGTITAELPTAERLLQPYRLLMGA
jgi:hypothetical protein